MATGFAPYQLNDLVNVVGYAPNHKINLNGFVAMCYKNKPISTVLPDGGSREVRISHRQRATSVMVDTSSSTFCTDVNIPAKKETTITIDKYVALPWLIKDSLVAQYQAEAYARQNTPGAPSVGATAELVDIIYSGANALVSKMNTDLLGLITWGKNVRAAAYSATVNINDDTNINLLTEGEAAILSDYQLSHLQGRPQIVGAGLFHAYAVQQAFKGMNQAGINSAIAAAGWDFFPDAQFNTTVGSNVIGVFEPESVRVVEALEYQGFAGGVKPNGTVFGILPLTYTDPMGNSAVIPFDFMLRYTDCAPATFTDAYSGDSVAASKGWQLVMKKSYTLWQLPSDLYTNPDPSHFVNGALKFTITNS
jgi:hypothetical protein